MSHILISAGEASGDLHGARLVAALREIAPTVQITFLGGDEMAREASHAPLIHYRDMAYMGFSEVLRHLGDVRRNLDTALTALLDTDKRVDALVLIDYPSFNLRLGHAAHQAGIPVFYYIPPKVWAWKEWRVKQLRRDCTEIFSILPFETAFYRKHKLNVRYVGNPSVEEIDDEGAPLADADREPVLALVPGSRVGEIRNNLPVMVEAAHFYAPSLRPVIAAAPAIDRALYARYAPGVEVYTHGARDLMRRATAALVTSGTATLECALVGTPQVACYRANGSRVSYEIMKRLLSVNYVTLPNLVAGREIIPEMLLHMCTPDRVGAELLRILPGAPGREEQINGYAEMRSRLVPNPDTLHPAANAARSILLSIKS